MATSKLNYFTSPPAHVLCVIAQIPSEIKKYEAIQQIGISDRDIFINCLKEGIKIINEARTKIRMENPNLFL